MSQIQKSTDRSLMEDAIALTAAPPAQIQAFLDQHGVDLAKFLESDDLIELLAKEAIATSRPTIPNDALHEARSHIESQLDVMESKLDAHLAQWEDARAKRFAARLGAVPANVTRKINEHLGGYAGDAEFFCRELSAQLDAAFPLDSSIQTTR
jgi:phage shock protein A